MPVTWTVTDNILHETLQEIRQSAADLLDDLGQEFQRVAVAECPVSAISTPGYVHLFQTIGYMVDQESTFYQQFMTFYVMKDYAQHVNDGTSRMPPRPFFTDGVLAVDDHFDTLARRRFNNLMQGRVRGKR